MEQIYQICMLLKYYSVHSRSKQTYGVSFPDRWIAATYTDINKSCFLSKKSERRRKKIWKFCHLLRFLFLVSLFPPSFFICGYFLYHFAELVPSSALLLFFLEDESRRQRHISDSWIVVFCTYNLFSHTCGSPCVFDVYSSA